MIPLPACLLIWESEQLGVGWGGGVLWGRGVVKQREDPSFSSAASSYQAFSPDSLTHLFLQLSIPVVLPLSLLWKAEPLLLSEVFLPPLQTRVWREAQCTVAPGLQLISPGGP